MALVKTDKKANLNRNQWLTVITAHSRVCTTVTHNTPHYSSAAQSPYNRHCSDIVYWMGSRNLTRQIWQKHTICKFAELAVANYSWCSIGQVLKTKPVVRFFTSSIPVVEWRLSWHRIGTTLTTHACAVNKPTFSWSLVTTSSQPSSHMTGFLGLNSHSWSQDNRPVSSDVVVIQCMCFSYTQERFWQDLTNLLLLACNVQSAVVHKITKYSCTIAA